MLCSYRRYGISITLCAATLLLGCADAHGELADGEPDAAENGGSTGEERDSVGDEDGDSSGDESGSDGESGSSDESGETGGCGMDCAEPGSELWSHTFGGDDQQEVALDVALDAEGNVLVVGARSLGGDDTIAFLDKYAPGGGLLWSAAYDPTARRDLYTSVAADANNEIVVSATADEESWTQTRRYAPDGSLLWSYGDPSGNLGDPATAAAVAVAPDGTSLTVGSVEQQDRNAWWVARNPDATVAFARISTVAGQDDAYDVVAAADGGFAIVGSAGGATSFRRLDAEGLELWNAKLPAGQTWAAAHPSGEFFLASANQTIAPDGTQASQTVLTRIDADGNTVWTRTVDTDAGVEMPTGLTADPSGRLAITCVWLKLAEGAGVVTRVLDTEADVIWERFDGDGPFNLDRANAIAAGPGGEIAVAGHLADATGDIDAWVAVFAP